MPTDCCTFCLSIFVVIAGIMAMRNKKARLF